MLHTVPIKMLPKHWLLPLPTIFFNQNAAKRSHIQDICHEKKKNYAKELLKNTILKKKKVALKKCQPGNPELSQTHICTHMQSCVHVNEAPADWKGVDFMATVDSLLPTCG